MKKLSFLTTGTTPLLMHNGQLANPFNPIVKEMSKITAKGKNKTEADMERLAELQFKGGLYLSKGKPCIPGEVLRGALISGARKSKKGRDFERGIECSNNALVIYEGPNEPDKLWENESFRFGAMVRVGQSKVFRMRPIFSEWSAKIIVSYDPTVLNESDVVTALKEVGDRGLLMDWRGVYGKFKFEKI